MRIYVASSWRNFLHAGIVVALRRCGHDVYDFKHPAPGNTGFRWTDVDPTLPQTKDGKAAPWTAEQTRKALAHPVAIQGYEYDMAALRGCEAVVLVLPAGRSACWEFGYAMGQGKRGYVVQFEEQEPELMFREAQILGDMNDLFDAFGEPVERGPFVEPLSHKVSLRRKENAPCPACSLLLAVDPTRHFKECEKRADFPKASTEPCPACKGSGRV